MKNDQDNRQPWERQPHESSKSYEAFCAYRDAGPQRSLRKLILDNRTTSKLRQLANWSSRHGWVERAQSYDDFTERLARFENERERSAMLKRHAAIAIRAQSAAVTTLERTINELNEDPARKLTVRDAALLMDVGVKVERLSRGEPSQITELGTAPGRPIRITPEEAARKAMEGVLGISGGLVERVEAEEGEPEVQPAPNSGVIDPFAAELPEVPATEKPKETA